MNLFIDNNIVIDALKPNPDFETDAKRVFQLIWTGEITPFMSVNSLTDIFYVMQKIQGAEKAKQTIDNLMTAVNIVPLTAEDCKDALALPLSDFEDAIIAVCAKKHCAECIVSRDDSFTKAVLEVEVVTPQRLFEKLKG